MNMRLTALSLPVLLGAASAISAGAQQAVPFGNNGARIVINGGTVTINGQPVEENDPTPAGPTVASVKVPGSAIKPGQPYPISVEIPLTSGLAGPPPQLKGADGKLLTPSGQMTSFSTINGEMKRLMILNYEGTAPTTPGDYEIPAQSLPVGARTVSIPATKLTVRALAPGEAAYTPISMTLELDAGPYYVGQEIEATLTITGSPDEVLRQTGNLAANEDDSITISASSRRRTSGRKVVNGKTVDVYTIPLKFTAMSAGEKNAVLTSMVYVAQPGDAAETEAGPFGDPSRMKPRTLTSPPLNFTVQHAPLAGKPASFRGAVGDFTLDIPASGPVKGKAGEPMVLSFIVSGDTAPDKLPPPTLEGKDWIVKENAPVMGVDRSGRRAKQFNYTVTPLYGGRQKTPSGEISWFNPKTRAYVTATVPALDADIEGEPPPAGMEAAVAAVKEPAKLAEDPKSSGKLIAFEPFWKSQEFLPAQALLALLLVASALVMRRLHHLAANPRIAVRKKARRDMRSHANAAFRAHYRKDAGAYATQARAALRAGAAPLADIRTKALTGEETLAALPPGDDRDALRGLFAAEEVSRFSGETTTSEPAATAAALKRTITRLEKALR